MQQRATQLTITTQGRLEMFPKPSSFRRRIRIRRFLIAVLVLCLLDAIHTVARLPGEPKRPESPNLIRKDSTQSVFIASIHQDSAPRLHATWSTAVVDLVTRLGADNAFFSAADLGSSDGTRNELLQLKRRLDKLAVANSVVFGKTALDLQDDADEQPTDGERRPGWVRDGRKRKHYLRKVPLRAEARNRALAPLKALAEQGRVFQTILWIDDDIVFGPQDVLDLIDTRGGNYSAACAADIGAYPHLQSISALRDDAGRHPVSKHWPWFRSPPSRSAAEMREPVPLSSCWNGLTVFDAAPFYTNSPPKFRAVEDSLADFHVEAPETCLIHVDNAPASKGVWMNPNVRVAHSVGTYARLQDNQFPDWVSAVVGSWNNRIERWRAPAASAELDAKLRARVSEWVSSGEGASEQRSEAGVQCLVDDMEVIKPRGPKWWLFITQQPG